MTVTADVAVFLDCVSVEISITRVVFDSEGVGSGSVLVIVNFGVVVGAGGNESVLVSGNLDTEERGDFVSDKELLDSLASAGIGGVVFSVLVLEIAVSAFVVLGTGGCISSKPVSVLIAVNVCAGAVVGCTVVGTGEVLGTFSV